MFAQKLAPAGIIGTALLGFAILILAGGTAEAQPSFNVTFGGSLDSFRPAAAETESRQNVAGGLNLEHVFAEKRGRVFYDLDAGNYDSPGDWSFFQHNAGVTYRFGSADASGRKLFLNGSMVVRENGDAWTNAAYTAVGGGLNAEFHPRATATVRTGYRADYRHFDDLSALTQLEHRGFASVLVNFQSRTTLVVETQAGAKSYDGVTAVEVPVGESPAATTGNGGRGPGMGMGPGIRWTSMPTYAMTAQEGAAGLVTFLGRVAQSLTDRTGIHGQVMLRHTFGSVPPVLVTTPAGFFEDGVYDDPFASNGTFVQAGIKHVFANTAELAATGAWADKNYTSVTAFGADGLTLAGAPLRTDTVSFASVMWSQPLFQAKTGGVGLSADIGYRFMHHRSNDAYYNYTSHAVIVGFSAGY